jgi:hypothetical protein
MRYAKSSLPTRPDQRLVNAIRWVLSTALGGPLVLLVSFLLPTLIVVELPPAHPDEKKMTASDSGCRPSTIKLLGGSPDRCCCNVWSSPSSALKISWQLRLVQVGELTVIYGVGVARCDQQNVYQSQLRR